MRILLSGASGFIGRHLLKALLADGHHLVCALRTATSAGPQLSPQLSLQLSLQLSYVHADFVNDTDKSLWMARLSGVDAVINTVGIFRESGHQPFERRRRWASRRFSLSSLFSR